MKNEETGTTALLIPALESTTELIPMALRPAARDHILAWDAGQRLISIHESSHCVAAAAALTKVPVRAVDVTLRHGGMTSLGGSFEDTALPWDTSARMLDNMMVAMAGASGERLISASTPTARSPTSTTRSRSRCATSRRAFGGPGLFVGEDGLPHQYLTDEWRSRTLARIQELVAEAQVRADAIIAEHQDALMVVATAVYEHRRLADERLDALLESAGFTLPRPTA